MPDEENAVERDIEELEAEGAEEKIRQNAEQEIKHRILRILEDKGAVLPVELAVHTYSFPEEIAGVVSSLEEEGLIERQGLKTGEMIVLTRKGQETITTTPSL